MIFKDRRITVKFIAEICSIYLGYLEKKFHDDLELIVSPENIYLVSNTVLKDHQIIVRFITEPCSFTVRSVEKILHNDLEFILLPENINLDPNTVLKDHQITVRFMTESCSFTVRSVEEILHNELELTKVATRWIPKMVWLLKSTFANFHLKFDEFSESIVVSDEIGVYYYNIE